MLGRLGVLETWPTQVVVSQSTVMEIERLGAREAEPSPDGRRSLGKVGDEYAAIEDSPEDRKARADQLHDVLDIIRSSCKVVGCQELASIEREKREILEKAFGAYGAETIVLASKPNHLLWTDDYVLAWVARGEFGVRRAWTQVALQARTEAGAFGPEAFFEASAKLLGWGYFFTSSSLPVMLSAAALAGWNQNAWPLRQALDQLADQSVGPQDALRLAGAFIMHVYREMVLPEHRKALSVATLERLAKKSAGVSGVQSLLRAFELALPQQFRLDPGRAQELVGVIKDWLAERARGIVTL